MIDAFERTGFEVDEVGLTAGEAKSLNEENSFWEGFSRIVPDFCVEILEYLYSLPAALWLYARIMRDRPDIVYERYALGNFAGVLAAKWANIPIFLEVNSPLAQEKLATGGLSFPLFARVSEKLILKMATKVIVVSAAMKEIYVDLGVDADHLVVIPNGIVTEKYANINRDRFRDKYDLSDSVVIGFVGFVRKWHKLDCVLEMLAGQLKDLDVKLLIAGDGPARPSLEKDIDRLNIKDRVIWAGIVSHEDVPDLLAAVDIALQSEVTPYASPMKLFEYMAAEKAIVAPKNNYIMEIVEHDESALLFTPGKSDEMSSAICKLVKDSELRRRLGSCAKKIVHERSYTWDSNALRVQSLYEKL